MLKDAGLILMVLAGVGLGFSGSCRLTQRLEALNMCMQMTVYLRKIVSKRGFCRWSE